MKKRQTDLHWLLVPSFMLAFSVSSAGVVPGHDLVADMTSFRLERGQDGYTLRYAQNGFIAIPEVWLVPPDELEDEAEAYVSSFNYDEQVTAFPIGDGRKGLHVSSYEIQREGSARAAAGRDVFLVLDEKAKVLYQGGLALGITKERVRIMGCVFARFHGFIIGDINNDRLIDIGVTKEEVKCEEVYDKEQGVDRMVGPSYVKHPIRWYLFVGDSWKHKPDYDGKLPRAGYLKLPLIGLEKSPVDFVKELYRGRLKKQ